MVVNLGPVIPGMPDTPPNPQPNGLGHNPRCLRRDVNQHSSAITTPQHTFDLIVESDDVGKFHDRMMGIGSQKDLGVHIGGHYTIGGDPGGVCF